MAIRMASLSYGQTLCPGRFAAFMVSDSYRDCHMKLIVFHKEEAVERVRWRLPVLPDKLDSPNLVIIFCKITLITQPY
jgi:hypothetical protein